MESGVAIPRVGRQYEVQGWARLEPPTWCLHKFRQQGEVYGSLWRLWQIQYTSAPTTQQNKTNKHNNSTTKQNKQAELGEYLISKGGLGRGYQKPSNNNNNKRNNNKLNNNKLDKLTIITASEIVWQGCDDMAGATSVLAHEDHTIVTDGEDTT